MEAIIIRIITWVEPEGETSREHTYCLFVVTGDDIRQVEGRVENFLNGFDMPAFQVEHGQLYPRIELERIPVLKP